MKIYRRLVTWIMIGIVAVVNLVMAIVLFSLDDSPVNNLMDFVNISTNLATFVVLFTIVIAGGIVASEFSWGTIKMLLIRPVSRTKILLAKYIATLLFSIFLILIVLICSLIFGFLFFGTDPNSEVAFADVLKTYGFSSIDMIMTVTFAFMLSTVFRSQALAITLSFVILFFAGNITMLLSTFDYNWGKYILFANTDLGQYFNGREPFFEGTTLGFSITVVAIYFIAFHLISFYVFKKRDVAV
jgi:ABC-2 type transport system permease protein